MGRERTLGRSALRPHLLLSYIVELDQNLVQRRVMSRATTLVAIALLSASAGSANAEPPWTGKYSNLRYISEADDYVGLNLEISVDPTPRVRYELCEGWCNGALEFPAEINGGVLRFVVRQDLVDQDGKPAAPVVYRAEARFLRTLRGRRLVVTSPDQPAYREVLARLRNSNR